MKATSVTGGLFSVSSKADMRPSDAQEIITAGGSDKPRVSRCAEVAFTSCFDRGNPGEHGRGGEAR